MDPIEEKKKNTCEACGVDRRTKPDQKCDCWGY